MADLGENFKEETFWKVKKKLKFKIFVPTIFSDLRGDSLESLYPLHNAKLFEEYKKHRKIQNICAYKFSEFEGRECQVPPHFP